MQHYIASPRQAFTVDQIVDLIQNTEAAEVDVGVELIDMDLNLIEDISVDVSGGQVERSSFADLHGSLTMGCSRELDWGNAIVRPYYLMGNGVITARFNLGAYFATSPKREVESSLDLQAVTGYDILQRLQDTVGEVYHIDAGDFILDEAEKILIAQGFTKYVIDQDRTDVAAPSARTWEMADNVTWLTIVNDMMQMVGYRGVYSDWNGYLRLEQYIAPADRSPEWYYYAYGPQSMISTKREISRDYYDIHNRWVGVRSNQVEGVTPTEGDGIYTLTNEHDGPTSVDGRLGRVKTRLISIDAADQAALVAAVNIAADAEKRLEATVFVESAPNPLHWHFDRLILDDPVLGLIDVQATKWTLPFDGSDMAQEWTVI